MEKEEEQPIKFYKKNQQYGFLSNFYESPFKEGDFFYKTNEHYFQSKKYEGTPYEKQVISAKSPLDAFILGRNKDLPRRKDWQEIKDGVMEKGLTLKFTQNSGLK